MPCMNFYEERESRDSATPSFGEVDFDVKLVHRRPAFEVAAEPVGLLDQHDSHRRMRLQIVDHLAERGPTGLLEPNRI
jgi:hypothetical protein